MILSPKNHLQQTNLRQGYAKRSAHDELGAPDVLFALVELPASTEQSSNEGGKFFHPPRRCIVPGVLRQLQMKLWWRTGGRVLLGIPGKFVGGDWFTTAAQKMQIPFVRSLEVLLGP